MCCAILKRWMRPGHKPVIFTARYRDNTLWQIFCLLILKLFGNWKTHAIVLSVRWLESLDMYTDMK